MPKNKGEKMAKQETVGKRRRKASKKRIEAEETAQVQQLSKRQRSKSKNGERIDQKSTLETEDGDKNQQGKSTQGDDVAQHTTLGIEDGGTDEQGKSTKGDDTAQNTTLDIEVTAHDDSHDKAAQILAKLGGQDMTSHGSVREVNGSLCYRPNSQPTPIDSDDGENEEERRDVRNSKEEKNKKKDKKKNNNEKKREDSQDKDDEEPTYAKKKDRKHSKKGKKQSEEEKEPTYAKKKDRKNSKKGKKKVSSGKKSKKDKAPGTGRWSAEQTDEALYLVCRKKPVLAREWDTVIKGYNKKAKKEGWPIKTRTAIENLFMKFANAPKPTGASNAPPHVDMCKRAYWKMKGVRAIGSLGGLSEDDQPSSAGEWSAGEVDAFRKEMRKTYLDDEEDGDDSSEPTSPATSPSVSESESDRSSSDVHTTSVDRTTHNHFPSAGASGTQPKRKLSTVKSSSTKKSKKQRTHGLPLPTITTNTAKSKRLSLSDTVNSLGGLLTKMHEQEREDRQRERDYYARRDDSHLEGKIDKLTDVLTTKLDKLTDVMLAQQPLPLYSTPRFHTPLQQPLPSFQFNPFQPRVSAQFTPQQQVIPPLPQFNFPNATTTNSNIGGITNSFNTNNMETKATLPIEIDTPGTSLPDPK